MQTLLLTLSLALGLSASTPAAAADSSEPVPVTISEQANLITLANGLITAQVAQRSGALVSLRYQGLELMAQNHGGSTGGYWSSVGRGRPGPVSNWALRINPATNGGARAEISCELHNDPRSPSAPVDVDYRYALGRGEPWLYVYSVLKHQPGYPGFGVGEARYCVKLNPQVFDFMTVDADRRRLMPTGEDWDRGAPLNLKEARRMTTGVHKGEAEHKYDYSAVLAETLAYGWSSTKHRVGLWLINPTIEYLGGGPTKAELTGHLDVNPGGLPTLLNMWVGSHYGGTTISVATNEAWTKVVGPFLLYCNTTQEPDDAGQQALWQDALARAAKETEQWPYAWVSDPDYPPAAARAILSGQLVLHDPFDPGLKMSNVWVGVTAPDYVAQRFGFRSFGGNTNLPLPLPPSAASSTNVAAGTNLPPAPSSRTFAWGPGRGGLPPYVDWQRDAKFYQFWARADNQGHFTIPYIRPGTYTLHAIADGVLGEFTLTNLTVSAGETKALGPLTWTPLRFGRTVWEIGVPDRTAREFRHGDHYWQWGLYFDYPKEFPQDVNFVIGRSDWRRDWNFVQPPRILKTNLRPIGEDEEQADAQQVRSGAGEVRSSTWSVTFSLPEAVRGKATLRLAFCGTHVGCDVEALVNGQSIGETGPLPSTSAMQRDGIRAYWVEKDIPFDASLLTRGTNVLSLLSHAHSWSQGVMYDYLRLELDPSTAPNH
jgi:rhamnogalacturonan endolyase